MNRTTTSTIVAGMVVNTLADLKAAPIKTKGTLLVLVRSVENATSRAGTEYVKVGVADGTGTAQITLFHAGAQEAARATVGKEWPMAVLHVEVGEYRNSPSLEVREFVDMSQVTQPSAEVVSWILEKSPIPIAMLNLEFDAALKGLRDDLRDIVMRCLTRFPGFDVWPAANSAHHDYVHGLKEHTVRMLRLVHAAARLYPVDKDVLVAATILHDAAKTREYAGPGRPYKTPVGELVGHIAQSAAVFVEVANSYLDKLRLENPQNEGGIPEDVCDDPVYLNIYHCILSHHGEIEHGSPVIPRTPEAVLLHSIDTMDAAQCAVTKHTKGLRPYAKSTDKLATMDFQSAYMLTPKHA